MPAVAQTSCEGSLQGCSRQVPHRHAAFQIGSTPQLEALRHSKRPRHSVTPKPRAASAVCAAVSAPERVTPPLHELNADSILLRPEGHESQLPTYDPNQGKVHLAVVGAGPSGLSVAERVAAAGFKVCIIDPSPLAPWTNNYGVWKDEFDAMGLDDCLSTIWNQAHVFLDSTPEGKKVLQRPYGRVDRPKLKKQLLARCLRHGVTFHTGVVKGAEHGEGVSHVHCADGTAVRSSLVLDATGHSRQLIQFDKGKKFDPGFQGAYGITAKVESHPFDVDSMLFMDWRDDHTAADPAMHDSNHKLPTFLYVMPFGKDRLFLEETSLVARPAVDFPELKRRLDKRMAHYGIKVKEIEDEEYCLIPMGGVLPQVPQRIVGNGGSAGMVHPSTGLPGAASAAVNRTQYGDLTRMGLLSDLGYMVARTLGGAPTLADAIVEQLNRPRDKASSSQVEPGPKSEQEANDMARTIWNEAIWPVERLRQRIFFNFGMEVLLKLNLPDTRQFFAAFFDLSDYHWQGFLSARLTFPQLIGFGLALFLNSSNRARANLLAKGTPGLVGVFFSLIKTAGR